MDTQTFKYVASKKVSKETELKALNWAAFVRARATFELAVEEGITPDMLPDLIQLTARLFDNMSEVQDILEDGGLVGYAS